MKPRRVSIRPPAARAGLAAPAPTKPRRVSIRPPAARAGLAAPAPTKPRRVSIRPPAARAGLAAPAPTKPRRVSIRPPAARAGLAAPAPISRLDATFARLRARGERALVAYVMAGDPSLAETRRLVVEAERRGADVIELGVPFSDPLADGPVIQRAGARALAAGASLPRVLEMVATLRAEVNVPLALMTYYNPILAFGLKSFARTAVDAGVDGVIVPDLPYEESEPLRAEAEPAGLDLIQFVAPTSTPTRVKAIARLARGFIYLVSLTGVTGERRELPKELDTQIRTLRLVTTKPVCVGFGVSSPEHAAAVGRLADGVAVGSAIVRAIEQHAGTAALIERVGDLIASLKAPLRSA